MLPHLYLGDAALNRQLFIYPEQLKEQDDIELQD